MQLPACVRRVGATLATLSMLALTACASSTASQDSWAEAIEALDGVISVNMDYYDGGLTTSDRYKAEIINAPDLTDEQARDVAAESCKHDTEITQVRISTSSAPNPTIGSSGLADQACIDTDAIVRYARASTAINSLPAKFPGSVLVHGLHDVEGQADGPRFLVKVGAADEASLLDALGALHKQIQEFPLTFDAAVSETGSTLTREGEPIKATLSPGANLDTLLPLIKSALKLDRRAITMTDDSLTVRLASSKNLESPKVEQLHKQAHNAGIALETGISPFTGNTHKHDLLERLLTVPGGATVKSPHDLDTTEVSIYHDDVAGIGPAAKLLVASEFTGNFRMYNPQAPDTFWVDIYPRHGPTGPVDEASAEHVSNAVAATKNVRTQLADRQGVDRVILSFDSDGVTLSVHLEDSAGASAESLTRDTLGQLPKGVFDEVTLDTRDGSERLRASGDHLR